MRLRRPEVASPLDRGISSSFSTIAHAAAKPHRRRPCAKASPPITVAPPSPVLLFAAPPSACYAADFAIIGRGYMRLEPAGGMSRADACISRAIARRLLRFFGQRKTYRRSGIDARCEAAGYDTFIGAAGAHTRSRRMGTVLLPYAAARRKKSF